MLHLEWWLVLVMLKQELSKEKSGWKVIKAQVRRKQQYNSLAQEQQVLVMISMIVLRVLNVCLTVDLETSFFNFFPFRMPPDYPVKR